MKENKIEKWINDSNENKAYPILILKVKDENIENVFNSIKRLNNIKRHFFVNKVDYMQQENKFSAINQILIIKKNLYISTNEMKNNIRRGCIYIEDITSIYRFRCVRSLCTAFTLEGLYIKLWWNYNYWFKWGSTDSRVIGLRY